MKTYTWADLNSISREKGIYKLSDQTPNLSKTTRFLVTNTDILIFDKRCPIGTALEAVWLNDLFEKTEETLTWEIK